MQTTYENCHIFHLDKFVPGFLDFLSEHIGLEDNGLFIWGQERYAFGLKKGYPIHWVHNNESFQNLVSAMRKAKRVFLHGLFVPTQVELLYQETELLTKCFWIIWGGDLYKYRESLDTPKKRLYETKRRYVISNIGNLITGIPGEFEIAVEVYSSAGRFVFQEGGIYPSNEVKFRGLNTVTKENKELKDILVGNSATMTNNHKDAFFILSNFLEEINVYCPLTYGDSQYRESVVCEGYKIFGERFFPILEHLPLSDYEEFLGKIDIALFLNNRQQAFGNIVSLLSKGKTVYADLSLSHTKFLLAKGLVILNKDNFSLSMISDSDGTSNSRKLADLYSLRNLVNGWKSTLAIDC